MIPFSKRESEALTLVIFGMSNQEIAKELFITEAAVKHLLNCASRKLNYPKVKGFRNKFVSDFFLGRLNDSQLTHVYKCFRNRLIEEERAKNPQATLDPEIKKADAEADFVLPKGLMQ